MKWSYCAFLIFSAFLYQRLVFYPPVIKSQSRGPASSSKNSFIEFVHGFYPKQSDDFLMKRITANKNLHSFYRAFVPVYYDIMKTDTEVLKIFSPAAKYVAVIGGDINIENFSFVANSLGPAKLVLNNLDDVTRGPLYLDVVRHFISGKILSDNLQWKSYIEAYRSGLRNDDFMSSDYVKKSKQNAHNEVSTYFNTYVSSDIPIKFIKYKNPTYLVDENRKKEISHILKQKFPKIKIFDQYLLIKEDGGSAGLFRYQVLAQLNPSDDPVWFDIKELTVSSYDKVFSLSTPANKERMSYLKDAIYPEDLAANIFTITLGGKDFLVRYMNQFSSEVKVENISHLELSDVVLDEAYVLGQMHARSLARFSQNLDQYAQSWDLISNESVSAVADKIIVELKIKYSSNI